MTYRFGSSLAIAGFSIMLAAPVQAQAAISSIPAGNLKAGLDAYAQQRGIQLIYRVADVASLKTPGASAGLDNEAALAALLAGTGLEARTDMSGAIAIVRTVRKREAVAAMIRPASLQVEAAPAATEAPATTADDTGLTEIVVTAQKRAESLQDVPIAIAAVTSDMLAKRGISAADGLATAVPGLQMARRYASSTPFIRGVGSNNSSPGDESGNGLYIDGVYRPSLPGGLFNFNSVERIEVLKGPQGTLFGRNAIGGVINVITKNPDFDPSFDMQIGLGNYRTIEASMYGTGGLTENLAADLSVYYRHQDEGYVDDLFLGRDTFKGKDFSVRSKLRWQSPDDRTEAVLSLDYSDFYADTGINTNAFGDGVLLDGSRNVGFYKTRSNLYPIGHTEQYGAGLTLSHDMDWARIVSISSYRKARPTLIADQDATPLAIVNIFQYSPQRTITQELQILSPAGSKVSWVGGLYYYNDIGRTAPLRLSGASFPGLPYRETRVTQHSKSYAAFAQATAPIFTDTNFTAGIRYTKDKRRIFGFSATDPVVAPPNGILPDTTANQKASFPKVTYRFVLDHDFGEDFMTYLSYSRGFKSGVFNFNTPTDPPVEPTVLDAYEVGAKSQFFDDRLRLNASAYFYQYKNLQFSSVAAGTLRLVNAAEAEIKGFDVEMEAALSRQLRLQASLTYLHGRFTKFPDAPRYEPRLNAAGVPIGGNRLVVLPSMAGNTTIQTPPITANLGMQYEIPTDIGTFNFAASAAYNDGFFWNPDNRLREPNYTLVNGSITWTSPDKQLDIQLWGRNLLDEKYHFYATAGGVGDTGSPAPPLTFGVTLGAHF